MNRTFYLFVCLFILSSFGIRAQYQWHALSGAPQSYRFDDMHFINPLQGWAINPAYMSFSPTQYGRVFKTNDGGQTWSLIHDSSLSFYRSVGFADDQHGWIGNLANSIFTPDTTFMYQTNDGGVNWTPVTNYTGVKPKGICGISVVTDSVVYAYGRYFGPPVLMKTINQGQSWITQDMSFYATGLVDGYFFSKDTGFISGSWGDPKRALLLSTDDGGSTWQVRVHLNRPNEYVWKLSFPSRMVGYASIENTSSPGSDTTHFLKTIDGGVTWQEHIFRTDQYYDLQGCGFINDSVGWIGGDCCIPKTFKTVDGGMTWNVDTSFVSTPVYSFGGYVINRFRRFGDSLMYASGNTIYKMKNNPTSTIDLNLHQLSCTISPNPCREHLMIQLNQQSGLINVSILNIFGQVIYQGEIENDELEIDTRSLPSGLMLVNLTSENQVFLTKIIKE